MKITIIDNLSEEESCGIKIYFSERDNYKGLVLYYSKYNVRTDCPLHLHCGDCHVKRIKSNVLLITYQYSVISYSYYIMSNERMRKALWYDSRKRRGISWREYTINYKLRLRYKKLIRMYKRWKRFTCRKCIERRSQSSNS